VSSGLTLEAGAALNVTGTIELNFEPPAESGTYWGLRAEGSREAELQQLIDDGNLVVDDSQLAGPVEVFFLDGFTYVGLAAGQLRITEFTVTDQATGSEEFTTSDTVDVSLAAVPSDGSDIEGYVLNETGTEPTEGWAVAPGSYQIQAAAGSDVTIHAFVKDTGGNVATRIATIYYQPGAPEVTNLAVEKVTSTSARVTWDTSFDTYGYVRYKLTTGTEWTETETARTATHGHMLTGLAPESTYVIEAVNNGQAEAPIFYPEGLPIPGDANMDCKVNVLDLIFVRNRLNKSIESGQNWQANVNQDSKINVLDLIYVRNRLNTRCPEE
jgi:hypothetical protein